MIGEYALWIGNNEPSQLPALQFIMTAVSQPEISQAAASALYKVCDVCRTNLAPIAPDLVGVVNTLQSQPNGLEQEDFFKVVKSVASVLQALPTEQRTPLVLVSGY